LQYRNPYGGGEPVKLKLKGEPLGILETENSPVALHARRRWMGGAGRARSLARETVKQIKSVQRKNGSWDDAVALTVQNLFALWLLVDSPDKSVMRAVDWMLEAGHPPLQYSCNDGADYSGMFFRTTRRDHAELRRLRDVPFTPGCSGFVKTGASLFFAVEFGKKGDPRVRKAFTSINRTAEIRKGRLCTGSCANNLHLALAVDQRQHKGLAVSRILACLAREQNNSGVWERGLPFYPTLWFLSHLRSRKADTLFFRALNYVRRSQNRDGSWGRSQRLLDTFLVLDSLERKKIEVAHGSRV